MRIAGRWISLLYVIFGLRLLIYSTGVRVANEKALERYKSYKHNELKYKFPQGFTGKLADLGLQLNRTAKSGIRAAVIREKGCQCERETAWALHLAGFDVKDVHMTDLDQRT